MGVGGFLEQLANAFLQRKRDELGITDREAKAQAASSEQLLRQAQVQRLMQQLELAPAESESERGLRAAQTELAGAQAGYARERPDIEAEKLNWQRMKDEQDQRQALELARVRGEIAASNRSITINTRPEPGSFSTIEDPRTGEVKFFNPKSGRIVDPPAGFGAKMSPTERTQRAGLDVMLEDVNRLQTLKQEPNINNSIGWIEGKIAAGKRATGFGETSPTTNELFRIADNLSDQLLRARSGAQINEQEYARLRSILPNPRVGNDDKFWQDVDLFKSELERTISARYSRGSVAPPTGSSSFRVVGARPKQ